jgi:hypothetical protein
MRYFAAVARGASVGDASPDLQWRKSRGRSTWGRLYIFMGAYVQQRNRRMVSTHLHASAVCCRSEFRSFVH